MKAQHIARLESQLERLVEGTFTSLFGKKIHAQDIAVELARALEDGIKAAHGSDPRPLAPDQYLIYLNPDVHKHLLQHQPALVGNLSQYMVELANNAGYRMTNAPIIKILADANLDANHLVVSASHTNRPENSTAVMQRVEIEAQDRAPNNPQIIIDGGRTVQLGEPVINIGRGRENDIVIDDPYASRQHVQLRLRFGNYMLFDIHSQGGTFVNEVKIKEHLLRSGDVIRIGRTRLLYVEDDPQNEAQFDTTEIIDVVHQDDES
jgi:hypothetical protein